MFDATTHELKTDIVKNERKSESEKKEEMGDWKNPSDDNDICDWEI